MIEVLKKSPDQFFEFSDDERAKALLFDLRLIDKFSRKPPIGSGNQTATKQVVTGETETHWILAFLFLGNKEASENGYMVYALPKSQYPPKQMQLAFTQILAMFGMYGDELLVSKRFSEKSADN